MKMQTWYELWISYGKKHWHDLKRPYEDYNKAIEIANRIAEGHKTTTRIAVVTVILRKETSNIVAGQLKSTKNHFYGYCKSCGNKRKNSNINQKTGDCITCEMRKTAA